MQALLTSYQYDNDGQELFHIDFYLPESVQATPTNIDFAK